MPISSGNPTINYKKGFFWSLALSFFFLLGTFLLFTFARWPVNQQELALEYPVYAQQNNYGELFVLDSSSRRVVGIGEDRTLDFETEGGSRSDDSFFYAREIAPLDDGSFLLLNNRLDEKGFYLTHEEILLYDSQGRYESTLVRREYKETDFNEVLVQRGALIDLRVIGNSVWWFELHDNGIQNYSFNFQTGEEVLEGFMEFTEANLHIGTIHRIYGQSFVLTLKDGSIGVGSFDRTMGDLESLLHSYSLEPSVNLSTSVPPDTQFRIVYRYTPASEGTLGVIPWSVGLYNDSIIFTDLQNQSIQRLESDGSVETLFNREKLSEVVGDDVYPYYYYSLTTQENRSFITSNDEGVVLVSSTGQIEYLGSALLTLRQRIFGYLFWISSFGALGGIVFTFRGFFYGFLGGKISPLLVRAFGLSVLILVVGSLSSLIIIPNFSGRYQDVVLQKISQMLQIIPQIVDAEGLKEMSSPEDYNSPTYRELRSNLMGAFNQNKDDWNRGYYFALYRIFDERLYGFMYMNGQINPYYPFDWLMGPDEPGVYDLAWQGEIATELVTDISGDWIYGVGPIFDKEGKVIALFETGTDLYALQYENTQLIRNLILELFVILIVVILLVVELTFLGTLIEKRNSLGSFKALPDESSDGFNGILFTRPIAYLLFTALSLSVAFLPILSSRLYVPQTGDVADVIIALPLVFETLGFGLATLAAGFLAVKLSWQGLFYGGVLLSAMGLYGSAATITLSFLTVFRGIVGLGSGLAYMGLRSIINREQNSERRSIGFSNFYAGMTAGINTGLVVGASLADVIGFQTVFYVAALLMGVVFLLPLFIGLSKVVPLASTSITSASKRIKDMFLFLFDIRIWVFFVSLILPTYIAGSYIAYYFPLFAEGLGVSTADIGRLLIINGLFIVYFGPVLSRTIERKIGNVWGSVLGSVFWGVALLIAAWSGSLGGAVIALILMGITEGFAVNTQNNVFLEFPSVEVVGADQAVGIYELMGKFGETLGPLIFGVSLLLGARFGLTAVGLGVASISLVFVISYGVQIRSQKSAAKTGLGNS
ncbi:MAG: MFS transporter [Spirochaetales bacterium]|nr:MFS transporter [Spirochaetales bacterium]